MYTCPAQLVVDEPIHNLTTHHRPHPVIPHAKGRKGLVCWQLQTDMPARESYEECGNSLNLEWWCDAPKRPSPHWRTRQRLLLTTN